MAIMTDLKDTPLAKLSLEEVTAALIMLIPNCVMLGHQSIPSTSSTSTRPMEARPRSSATCSP